MKLPLQIVFRNMAPSEAVDSNVREHVGLLEKCYDKIMSCRVMIEGRWISTPPIKSKFMPPWRGGAHVFWRARCLLMREPPCGCYRNSCP